MIRLRALLLAFPLLAVLTLSMLLSGISVADEDVIPEIAPNYAAAIGKVVEINEYVDVNGTAVSGWLFISIEDENSQPSTILVTDKTYFPFEDEILIGDIVTAYYPANMPMIMIYPPQYRADVLVVGLPENQMASVDRFSSWTEGPESYLVSSDNTLAFTISESTTVLTVEGELFDGDLNEKCLVVIYDFATRSIPAQTTPITVIVLPDERES